MQETLATTLTVLIQHCALSSLQDSMSPYDDGAIGISPPQSSVSQQEGPGTSPSMMGGASVKAYSARNGIDPAFQHAIEQRSTFWKSKVGSTGQKCAPPTLPPSSVFLSIVDTKHACGISERTPYISSWPVRTC